MRAVGQGLRTHDDGVRAFHGQAVEVVEGRAGNASQSVGRNALSHGLFRHARVEFSVEAFVEDVVNDLGLFEVRLVGENVLEVSGHQA